MSTPGPRFHRSPAARRAARRRPAWRAGALAAALLAIAAACRPTPPPDAPDEPTERPQVSITGACAGEARIDPLAVAGPKDWAPASVAETTPCFRLTATAADAHGVVDPTTAFVLESAEALDPDEVAALLAFAPPIEVEVTRDKPVTAAAGHSRGPLAGLLGGVAHAQSLAHRYRITPAAPLAPGGVQRIALRGSSAPDAPHLRSWAFQARAPLAVVHTLPADESTWVPTDTGIELTFNRDGVDAAEVERRFHIEPAVDGRFEQRKRTVVFVPRDLVSGTLYTVRLDAGVPGPDGEATSAPTIVRFQTRRAEGYDEGDPRDRPALFFRRPLWESPTDEAPVVGLFRQVDPSAFPLETATVEVLRYDDDDAFIAALDRFQAVPRWADLGALGAFDAVGASPVVSFTTPIEAQGEFGEVALRFPEPLEAGRYRLRVTVDGFPVPAGGWLQVTDVAAYSAVSAGSLAVWAHDAATGDALEGATVAGPDGRAAGTTDAEGVAFVDTPAGVLSTAGAGTDWARDVTTGTLTVTAADGRSAVVPLGDAFFAFGGGFREFFWGPRGPGGRYWRYLYTDRQLYRLSDTVRFWGIAQARDGAAPVESVTVEVSGGDWTGYDYRPIAIAQTTVVPDAAGVYSGQLSFRGASPSWYTLRARVGDQVISLVPLSVEDVVLPAYQIQLETSRRAVLAGEAFSATATATFFDGTPVGRASLLASFNGVDRPLTTGEDGSVSWTVEAPAVTDALSQGWQSFYLSVRAATGEEGDIGANADIQVFEGANALVVDGVIDAGDSVSRTATVSGTVHALDLSRRNGRVTTPPDDILGAVVPGAAVTVRFTETEQVRIETGERYDFVAKRVVKTYRYDSVSRPGAVLEAVAGDDGRFAVELPARDDLGYEAQIEVEDDQGRRTARRIWLGLNYLSDPGEPLTIGATGDTAGERRYRVGDVVDVTVLEGGVAAGDGRYLFLWARNGLLDHTLSASARLTYSFGAEHLPNVHTLAARWDGRSYRETISGYDARFDASERRLSVAVGSDRPSYGPGDEATVAVTVTDAAGAPVEGASVLVSGVDAAIIQAQGAFERPDPLTALYESAPAGVLRTYASHAVPKGEIGAEGGGGGGDRSVFEDVAIFEQLTTDGDGRAEATVTLPDNLTSWLVTSLAATADLAAGSGFGVLAVGKPLFVDATLNRTYVTADEPSVRLRAFGSALAEGGEVSFTLASDTLLDAPIEVAGEAFAPAVVPLGPLPAGTHELRLTARAGGLEDTVVRRVTVLPSRLSRTVAESRLLAEGETADLSAAGDGAVEVVVADANRGGLYADVAALADAPSDRLDEIVARAVGQELLAAYFGERPAVPIDLRSTTYQTQTGALTLFPYGPPDIGLTADVALAAPDRFGRQGMGQALRAALDAADIERADAIVALRGLAAIGEPVLRDVRALLDAADAEPALAVTERLDLGLAAALLGDADAAEAAYRAVLTAHGQLRGTTARVDDGDTADDVVVATARAALLGALLGDDLAPALHAYATREPARDVTLAIWHAAYLRAALPRLADTAATVRYTLPAGDETVALEPGRPVVLHLTRDLRDALDLRVVEGTASVTVVGREAVTTASGGDPDLALTRAYGPRGSLPPPVGPVDGGADQGADGAEVADDGDADEAGDEAGAAAADAEGAAPVVEEGQLVVVTLTPTLGAKAASGCYQVSDLLPSGLRPVSARYVPGAYYGEMGSDLAFPYAIEGQRVSFCAWADDEGIVRPLRYLARAFAPGRYAAEPALVQALSDPTRQAASSPATIEIRPRDAAP